MMLVLYGHVFLVRRSDIKGADTWNVMNIHVNRHVREFGCLNIYILFNISAPSRLLIEGTYYADPIGTTILFPSGKMIQLRLMRAK